MKTRQRMRNTTCILLLVLLTVAAPGALASAPAQTPDIADASLAPAAPSATLLVHFDAANIDGTGTQSGDICGRTNTTWVNLANPGTNNGTLVNVTMPCTADEGWKGDGGVASPYRLHLNGPGSGVWGADYVSFGTLTAPRSFNLWFYVDVDASGYLFSLTNNYTRAFLNGVTLEVAYNQSPTRSTGIATGVWHMLTMTNDGTMNRFYLDNVEFAAVAGSPLTGSVSGNLGKASVGAADQGLNGSIAEYSVYSDALSRTDITALYQNGRYRFEADSGQVQIDRIQNAFSSPAGGQQVTLHGQHFENITGVTFDDLPGTNVTVLDQSRLTVTAPAHVPGYVDVQVISSTRGSDTRLAAFRYTETPIDNLQLWLDAGNVDTLGAKGEGTVSRAWKNLTYGSDGELRLVDQPGTASEGWKGGGWPSDPFRLELGRGGNYVGLAMNAPRSVNIWFSFDQLPVNVDNVLLSAQYVMVVNHVGQNLRLTYHDGAVQQIPVSPGSNMLTVANDGTTTRYYLNGNEVASEVWSPATAYAATAILGTFGGYITSKEWDGSLCSVRFYNDYLTPAEVTQLYEEEENCVVWPLPTVSVGSLVWEDTDGDGLQEVGEPGIANATVRLLDPLGNAVTDAEGQLVQPQITGADGLYNFGNLKKGSYRVEVALPDGSNLQATTLPVDPSPDTNPDNLDSNGLVQEVCDTPTVRINQQVAPNDFQDQGVWWEDLGWFDIANPQVTVRLTDDANGYVIADAVRFQGSSGVRIIDNGAPGYSQSGFIPYGAGYQGDEDYTAGDNTGDAATWLFDNLAPDSYRVSVTYVAQSNRATNSPYIFSALGPCAQVYRSPTFVLDLYSEPVGEQFADGSSDQDGKRDSNGNMTVDFGFWPSPLAVALASFAAEAQADHVLVTWETVSETGNTGFNLYRSASESAQGELMAFLPSQAPGGLQGFAYSVQDEAVMPGVTYWYWLEAVDIHGTATRHGPVSATYEAPMAVALTSLDTKPGPGQGETVWWLVLVVGLGWAAILPTLNRARIKRR